MCEAQTKHLGSDCEFYGLPIFSIHTNNTFKNILKIKVWSCIFDCYNVLQQLTQIV